ncbi:GAF and ANTAR domain-containing protein [Streptomyces sp. HD]|uniref:GAF and ANTAR domain-containing protein n=1 Tax=Streptomyces sp. HD TaxID=3020892 RepID=UPI00232D8200|nr:GAF and ANTAR domain-containing protein [Streptomyces sp. HD]MDC0765353.1 GAF and ANTAR domain-containing protein [Streptomyces sp. HD]
MNRERQLAQAFVALSDTYAAEFDPLQLFHRLVHTCRDLLDADAAAVMIADARGSLKSMATTDEEAAFAALLQVQNGYGPCMDCYRTGQAVSVPDIAVEFGRWPKLVNAMGVAGYDSLLAVPMRLHERTLGALALLRRRAGHLTGDDVHLAQALADSATLALMHWSTEPARGDDVITRVQSAIASKATLDIAKGMLAEYSGATVSEAGRLLNAYARHQHARITETAYALVSRALEPAAILSGQPQL